MSTLQQLDFAKDYWWAVIFVALFNTGYEMVLWEHIRKVALSQLAITVTSGLLWLNLYQMIIS